MANRKAKQIVKAALEAEKMEWSVIEEANWNTCIKHHYFESAKTVWDYIYLICDGLSRSKHNALMKKYSKESLIW